MGLHTGCKSKQHTGTITHKQTPTQHKVISNAIKATPQFHTAEVSRMSIKIQMEKRSLSTSARFTLQHDSLFHLSILPLLGIEAFRAEVSPTNAIVVDKMNKRYVQCQLDDIALATGLKIGYQELQALISAQLFAIGDPQFFLHPGNNILVTTAERTHTISFTCNGFDHEFRVVANGSYQLLSTTIRKSNTPYIITVNYSAYQLQDNVLFPHTIEINFQGGKQMASCTFSLLKTRFNQPIKFTQTPLNRYTPITLQELLSK